MGVQLLLVHTRLSRPSALASGRVSTARLNMGVLTCTRLRWERRVKEVLQVSQVYMCIVKYCVQVKKVVWLNVIVNISNA